MELSRETLKAIIADYDGVPLTDAELDLVQPELDRYAEALKELDDLDLSTILSARLLHASE